MQSEQRKAFGALISDALAFYGQTVSAFALTVWWASCQPFELEQVSSALTGHAMDPERGQFPPKPADLVRVLQGTQTDRALIAWGKVFEAMQRVGAWQSVVFDDGLIHAVVEDIGGWVTLCRSTTDELPFVQRRFSDAYRAYARRPSTTFPGRLPGVAELENRTSGHPTAPPMLIGHVERAQEVMRMGMTGPKTQITDAGAALRIQNEPVKRLA